ncbi:hypothetical protein ACWDSD_24455 [Streptomyces spiralis]
MTLRSPGPRPAYTTVFETTAATAPQNVSVTPTGKLPRGALHRWTTTLESTDPGDWFVRDADVSPDAMVLSDSGTWALEVIAPDKTTRVLANGTLPSAAADTWHRLTLGFSGDTITARVDGTEVAHVTDSTYGHGQVGLGLDSYTTSQFDDLEVLPARNASTVTP